MSIVTWKPEGNVAQLKAYLDWCDEHRSVASMYQMGCAVIAVATDTEDTGADPYSKINTCSKLNKT